jgi:ATP-dependent helicase/nuclease subunit A
MSEKRVIDAGVRLKALDTSISIAVQAPAGSGKTELLSLRFLKLLAKCTQPEEVLAITFTRKAAAEMTNRIIETLEWAAAGVTNLDPDSELEMLKFTLASQVLEQDKAQGWQLLQTPNQLRIQTIDSFCHHLARNLPVLSNFGNSPQISDQVEECYQEAVTNTLALLDTNSVVAESVGKLLRHFDNKVTQVETLLIGLLQQRDQWSSVILEVAGSPQKASQYLQENLHELVEETLQKTLEGLLDQESQLAELLNFAAENLRAEERKSAILLCAELTALPAPNHQALRQWQGLAELLLTRCESKPTWRKQLNKGQGFPAPSSAKNKDRAAILKQAKSDIESLLDTLSEKQMLLENLDYVRRLPEPDTELEQWQFLITLTSILPTLLAQLKLSFAKYRKVDHSQVSSAALEALGDISKPTDLTLALDYKIQHILVDEFQDTSSTQIQLLQKLTAGWEVGDRRTLFIVGDAMQSCYGFRSANVGLFIAAREYGIGDISLLALSLETNFRSTSNVVSWVNAVFSAAFPAVTDIARGAIDYSASSAFHSQLQENVISTRVFLHDGTNSELAHQEEARHVAKSITAIRENNPTDTIAVLVRYRTHLPHILAELRAAGIPWQATEIDKLAALPVITDLTSLISALLNQADRLAWLSILRAPWCGLSLEELHTIATYDESSSILHTLQQADQLSSLKQTSQSRIKHFVEVLSYAHQHMPYNSLNRVVRVCWEHLQGHALYPSTLEHKSAERFFELITEQESAGTITDFKRFERRINQVTISGEAQSIADNPVSIMTIHKAKGLEFDHVIVPGLARIGKSDTKPLLLWHERLNFQGLPKLFLATLSATGADDGALYKLIRHEKSLKDKLENTRLLYIAVTRAKKSACLMASLTQQENVTAAPSTRSLLATIWQPLQDIEQSQIQYLAVSANGEQQESATKKPEYQPPKIRRLAGLLPCPNDATQIEPSKLAAIDCEPTSRATRLSAEVGNLVHQSLQNHVIHGPDTSLQQTKQAWKARLIRSGYSNREVEAVIATTENLVKLSTSTDSFNWIFNNELEESEAELSINSLVGGYLHTHIIDRTFIDSANVRWIIDYKSAKQAPNETEAAFVNTQIDLHTPQLTRYKTLFSAIENRPIKTALLFTSIPKLIEVDLNN